MLNQNIYEMVVGNKVYIGRTTEDVEQRVVDHEKLLIQDRHFNKIAQIEYNENPKIDYSIIYKDVVANKANKIFVDEINKKNTFNNFIGLNHYLDKKTRNSKTYKPENSPEDIIFHYLDDGVFKNTQDKFGINYVTLLYHLNKYWVLKDSKPSVSCKKDMIYAGIQVLILAEKPLTSSQIVERIYEKYNVGNKINFTPRQLSILIKVAGAQKVGKSPIVWVPPV